MTREAGQDAGVFDQQHRLAAVDYRRALQEPLASRVLLQMDQAALAHQEVPRATSENAVKTQIWCAVSTYVLIAIVKKELKLEASLYTILQILSISVFDRTLISQALQPEPIVDNMQESEKQLILFDF